MIEFVAAEVSNQDVENGIGEITDFIAKVWDGIMAVLDVLPPIVIGFVAVILLVMWLARKAKHG